MEEFKDYYSSSSSFWEDYVGFADIYRKECKKESKRGATSLAKKMFRLVRRTLNRNNEIDKELYAELVKLDTRLGLKTITI